MDEQTEQSIEQEVKEKINTPENTETKVVEEHEVESTEEHVEEEASEESKERYGILDKIIAEDAIEEPEVKDDTPEEVVEEHEERPKPKRLEEKTQEELIEDVKKWMSIAEKRKVEKESISQEPPDEKYTKFIDALKTDFFGGYKDYYDKFGLPSPQYLQEQLSSGGDRDVRMEQWQEVELIPAIEKKYNLEEGTFVPDPSELYKKGTPTEYFRRMTEQKERDMDREYEQQQKAKESMIEDIKKQREGDLNYIKENFFETDEEFQNKIEEFDSIPERIAKGELTQEKNPFAIRNIFKGIYFDELTERKVNKAIKDVHKQYNDLGIYLPDDGKGEPTDATQQKGFPNIRRGSDTKKSKFSMINREMNRANN